ncbi:unnamed protein product, partial [Ectocarpus sp. 12 AP-2014]
KRLLLTCAIVLITDTAAAGFIQYEGGLLTDQKSPFLQGKRIVGSVELGGALNPSFSGRISPTSFSFSDGRFTYDNSNSYDFSLFLTTDETSEIVGWSLDLKSRKG